MSKRVVDAPVSRTNGKGPRPSTQTATRTRMAPSRCCTSRSTRSGDGTWAADPPHVSPAGRSDGIVVRPPATVDDPHPDNTTTMASSRSGRPGISTTGRREGTARSGGPPPPLHRCCPPTSDPSCRIGRSHSGRNAGRVAIVTWVRAEPEPRPHARRIRNLATSEGRSDLEVVATQIIHGETLDALLAGARRRESGGVDAEADLVGGW